MVLLLPVTVNVAGDLAREVTYDVAMTASAPTGVDLVWPSDPRTRARAEDLYASVARRPLVSVHNGLPARYLARTCRSPIRSAC